MIEHDVTHTRLSRAAAEQVVAGVVLQVAPHAHPQMPHHDVVSPEGKLHQLQMMLSACAGLCHSLDSGHE
jgi:hypothetical protein